MKRLSLMFVCTLLIASSFCQEAGILPSEDALIRRDTLPRQAIPAVDMLRFSANKDSTKSVNKRFLKSLIIPAIFVGYGAITLENHSLRRVNLNVKQELQRSSPSFHSTIDNQLQYCPAVAVYALNAFGVKGKHGFFDRTVIVGLSAVLEQSTVRILKKTTRQLRPDGSNYRSFPSGHTANAFANAEFLHQEYKHISPWYGVAGYLVAAGTGGLRMYNNKHWFSDVITGAGIGILSTKLVYRAYPWISNHVFKRKYPKLLALPSYNNGSIGFAMVYRLNQAKAEEAR